MKKSKIFARKIISVILAVLMAASTFTGVLTAYAKSTDDNHDSKLAANFMAWAETTDNQTAEALLDWLDDTLQKAGIAPIKFYGNYVVVVIDLNIYIDSVDGLLDAVRQINGLLDSYGGLLGGDVKNINLSPIAGLNSVTAGDGIVSQCNRSYRAVNDAKDIVMALAKAIYWNSNDNTASGHTNKNIIGQFLKGQLDLGSILSGIVDVYGLIGGMLGMWSGYQTNLVYNLVANIILTKSGWYTDAEVADYQSYLQGNGGSKWNFDEQLFAKLSDAFLNKVALNITYSQKKVVDPETGAVTYEPTDSSEARFAEIKAWLEKNGMDVNDGNVAKASAALGYDPKLRYEPTTGKIYIFRYGDEKLNVTTNVKVYDLVKEALRLVWNSALVPTISILRVNNDMDWYEGHGGNFDNQFYYWLQSEGLINEENWEAAYTMENLDAYCAAKYVEYGYEYAEDFKDAIRKTFDYDRNIVDNPKYTWEDVAENNNVVTAEGRTESLLFAKLRYSPMADKIFNMQTGPINLYFMQTGFDNIEAFMDKFFTTDSYPNLIAAVNDLLVAAVYDFFPDSRNIGLGDGKNNITDEVARPVLKTTSTTSNIEIAKTIAGNLMKVLEYTANVTDENILSAFYNENASADKKQSNSLTEENIEGAVVPLAIACIQLIADTKSIHKLDWSYAKDAEGVAFVALREYLSFSLPKKDYDQLVSTSKGYYEAVKDVDGDGKYSLYLDVILPMARDAVGYLLNSVVPCRDKNGNIWNVYESNPATDKTTLFEILNSVICYYASMDEFPEPSWNTTASKTYGKGVASLLGVVNPSTGACDVTVSNTLWENIDNIANSVWPLLGTIQYGTSSKSGQFNSYEFLYDGVILPLLDIGTSRPTLSNPSVNAGGITLVLEQLLTMFTTDVVMNKGLDCLVYDDVVASFVNGVFGKRQNSQTYYKILPTSSDMNTTTPFDSMLQASVFAFSKGYTDETTQGSKENGILGNLVSNLYGALGGNAEETYTEMGRGSWQGLMFIVKAVSYLVPGFLPQLKDHQFNSATISVNEPSRSNITAGANIGATTITISNNATGLNRFYKNESGQIVADDRYFIVAKDLKYEASPSGINITFDNPKGKVIAPEEDLKINASANGPSVSTLITFILTYDVYLGTASNPQKTLLYSDQQATCYLNLSVDKDWAGKTLIGYDTNTKAKYPTKATDYTVKQYKKGKNVNVYNNLVINNANPAQVDDFGITENAIKGFYAADENGNAYVTFDSDTGDVIDVNRYDYNVDNTGWNRGTAVSINGLTAFKGYTYDELQAQLAPYVKTTDANGNVTEYTVPIQTRTHIGLMKIEDPSKAVIKTYETNASGKYTSVRVVPALVTSFCATASTPTTGISFVELPTTTSASNVKWLKYDGSTSVKPEQYDMNLCGFVDATTYSLGTIAVTIANTDGAAELQKIYNNYLQDMAPYQPLDYEDYNEEYSSSTTNDNLQKSFKEVVKQIAAPITLENASQLVSTTIQDYRKSSTVSATGDVAFKPAAVSATTDNMSASFFTKNGYYYYDEEFRFPVYSNEHLTDADVVNGKDKVGTAVVKNGDLYYIANTEQYEYGWNTDAYEYPYYGKIGTLATTETGAQLYEQVQFQYYTTEGKRVNSNDAWTYKFALTDEIIKPNDGTNDYRGFYTKLEDNLKYNVEEAKKNVDTSLMTMITDDIIAARAGKYSVNYDVATYEKMVQIARNGEKLVSATGVDEAGNTIYTTAASSVEIKEANRLFKKYESLVISRGYEGTKLEKEIAHLTGTTKSYINATYDEKSGVATVSFTGKATPEYGAVVDGQLVNAGETVYSDVTWNNYIVALAKAVITSKSSESLVNDAYVAKKNVVMAENALDIPAAATSYTVSGVVTEAIDNVGTAGTYALANVVIYADGEKLGRTAADGSFTVEIPLGVTDVTFEVAGGIDRTVSFDGETSVEGAQVGVIALDFNNDGKINATDAALGSKLEAAKLTGVNFKSIMRNGVKYNATLN